MLTRFTKSALCRITGKRFSSNSNIHVEEEYYEELEPSDVGEKWHVEQVTSQTQRREGGFLEAVLGALGDQKAKNLFVVSTDRAEMTPYSHKIICSAFNSRQAAAISENLRTLLKLEDLNPMTSHVKRSTKRSNGWYVTEIERVQVHVMSEECREKYDLETIWAGDDRILEEIDAEKQNMMFPPKRA